MGNFRYRKRLMVKGYIARKKSILNNLYFYHTAHINLWNWIYEDMTRNKFDWPGWKNKKYENARWSMSCFGCFYKDSIFEVLHENSCYKHCPFEINKNLNCLNGLYTKYCEYKQKYINITNYFINSQENYINILSQEKYYQFIRIEKELKNIIIQIRDFPVKKKINNRKIKLI